MRLALLRIATALEILASCCKQGVLQMNDVNRKSIYQEALVKSLDERKRQ